MTQIARKYVLRRFLPKILLPFRISDDIKEFCERLLSVERPCDDAVKISDINLLGDVSIVPLDNDERQLFEAAHIPLVNTCYQRMIIKRVKYHSKIYARWGKKTFDGGVHLEDNSFGTIQRIFTTGNIVYVIIRSLTIERSPIVNHSSNNVKPSHFKVCNLYPYGNLRLIRAAEICAECILLETDSGMFLSVSPNTFQKD